MSDIKNIQLAFYQHTYQRYEMLAPNIYLDWEFNEMDLLGLRRSGYIDEIEIKLSKSDFLADFKKTVDIGIGLEKVKKLKHEALQEGLPPCNYFSFLLPEELADKCDIPDYAGLYIYRIDSAGNGRIREEKSAKLLHKRKISERKKYEIGRKMAFRYWHKEGK